MVEFWQMLGLATTFILVTCAFFLFLLFFNKLLRVRKTTREVLPFIGLNILAIFISFSFFIIAWFDYYRWEYSITLIELYKVHNLLNLASFAAVTFFWEYALKKTKYVITLYMLVGMVLYMILSIFLGIFGSMEESSLYMLIFGMPLFVLCAPIWYLVFIRPTSGFLRRRMLISFVGFFLIGIGLLGRNDTVIESLGFYIHSVSSILMIIGLSLIGYGFAAFSTFTDLRWKEKLSEIFVISNNGVCLFAYSFEKNIPLDDSDLIAVGFSGIQMLLSEMVKTSESLHLIDYQNVKIMLEQGVDAMFVLIIKEESTFLDYKLKVFAEEFQTFFKEILQHWDGDIDVFKPTWTLIQRVFEVST